MNSALLFEQDGRQRHRGVELAANGPLAGNLTFIAGVSRLFTTQLDTSDVTVNGQRTSNAPNWQADLSFDYQVPRIKGLFFNAAVVYVGDRAVDFLTGCRPGQPFCLSVWFNAPHADELDRRQYVCSRSSSHLYRNTVFPVPKTS